MKKFFTLSAALFAALSMNAQDGLITFESGATYTDLQEITDGDLKLQLGNDIKKAAKWDNKQSSIGTGDNMAVFAQDVEIEGEMKSRVVYISGGNNPKDGADNTGSGYSPASKNIPQSGTYYMVTPTKSGKLLVGIILNANKSFYVVKKSDGECLAQEQLLVQDTNGGTVTLDADYKVTEKLYGTAEFDGVAGETYYVFCTGSKLGFFGARLSNKSVSTSISSAKVVKANGAAAAFNMSGLRVGDNAKGLVIKEGKKLIRK